MAKKTAKRVKHVPQRTCVGCRQTLAKRSLIRIVRTPEGLRVDPTGKVAGRGAYLHDRHACWESGLKGALAHALKVELTDQDRETLRSFMTTLPKDEEPSTEAKHSVERPLSEEAVQQAAEQQAAEHFKNALPLRAETAGKQGAETNRAENELGNTL